MVNLSVFSSSTSILLTKSRGSCVPNTQEVSGKAYFVYHFHEMTALVIGATGLVGKQLVSQLLKDRRFSQVICFVRKSMRRSDPGLVEHVVDFRNPAAWSEWLKGDVLFSCMGTTIRAAGSRDAQWEVDYTFQFQAASLAAGNGVKRLVLLSAAGASPQSRVFYSRMKGELERDVQELPFERMDILRPSFLSGKRKETRIGELIGIALMSLLRFVPGLSMYRPIRDVLVARAMITCSFRLPEHRVNIHEPAEVHKLGAPWAKQRV